MSKQDQAATLLPGREFRGIERFPSYLFSSEGEIVSFANKRAAVLKCGLKGKYLGATFVSSDGTYRHVYLHRLVAEAFYGPAPQGLEARHLDGNRTHNAAVNLRWGTRKQNMRDKDKHGTSPQGERHPMAKLDEQRVRLMRRLAATSVPIHLILKYFGISRMQHWRIVNNKLWNYPGAFHR